MRKFIALCLGAVLALAPVSAFAGVAYITGAGSGGAITNITFGGGTTVSATPLTTVPAGSLYIVIPQADNTGTNTFSNCHDNTANSWTADAIGQANGASTQIWHSYTANAVTTGGSVSCTNSIAGFTTISIAFSGTATSPFDSASPAGATNSGSSQTVGPSGTLGCPGGSAGCEVCVAAANWHVSGTVAHDATWTDVAGYGAGSEWAISYKIVSAATALSFTATTSASTNSAGAMACFQAPVASAARTRSLLGVGQ